MEVVIKEMEVVKRCFFVILIVFAAFRPAYAQNEVEEGLEAITESAVQGKMRFLASDWTEGREVGTKGSYLAADYIASLFQIYGIQPFGDTEHTVPSTRERMVGKRASSEVTYFQNFSLLEYSPGEKQELSVITQSNGSETAYNFTFKSDFNVDPGSAGRSGKAQVVFAGYGFRDTKGEYDDLKNIDLQGKVVLILAGFPGHRDSSSTAFKKFAPGGQFARNNLENYKLERLIQSGVIAVIHVNVAGDPALSWAQNPIYPAKGEFYEADEPLPSYYDSRMILTGDTLVANIPVFTATNRVAGTILSGTGIDPDAFEKKAAENMESSSALLSNKWVTFQTTVNSRIVKARNVLGIIEGEKRDEFIVVGAHYDHLGKRNGWIWNGADDNASGTVGVMTLAKAFMATGKKPEKSIIFAAWDGEERGLRGSGHFVRKAIDKDMNLDLYLNFDMIGRNAVTDTLGNRLSVSYTRSYEGMEELIKRQVEMYGFNLDINYRPQIRATGGSDHASFARRGIPYVYYFASLHPDYHLPSDELNKINWEKMTNIVRLAFLNVWEFANSDE